MCVTSSNNRRTLSDNTEFVQFLLNTIHSGNKNNEKIVFIVRRSFCFNTCRL